MFSQFIPSSGQMHSISRAKSLHGFLLAVFLCFFTETKAQDSYDFMYDSGTYAGLVGSTSINNGQLWDDPEYKIPIGFSFDFFDQTFDSLYVSDYVWFDKAVKYWIYAYDADFMDRGSATSISPISYKLSGTAGDRILKIEWNNAGFYGDSTLTDFINVQLWLYEGSNKIEVHVGPNQVLNPQSYGGDEGGAVGLSDKIAGKDIYLTGSWSSAMPTQSYTTLSGTPADGTIYTFEKCPDAGFVYTVDSGLTASMIANTSPDISSYYWDFGDGSGDTGKVQTHTFLDTGAYKVKLVIYSNCDPDTASVTILLTSTGLSEHAVLNNLMHVYPSPAQDVLHVLLNKHSRFLRILSGNVHLNLVDITGRTVFHHTTQIVNGEINSTIDVSTLDRGAYVLTVEAESLLIYRKVVKY